MPTSARAQAGTPKSVDIVVIGLNSASTLGDCLRSALASSYPREALSLYYADGGSTDGSAELARSLGAAVVEVEADSPSPGRQRNGGWRAGKGELVQFLDSDTLLDPAWIGTAAAAFSDGVGAVCGDRTEIHPDASVFNWIGGQDWNGKAGDAELFGGDVMISRSVLERTGGYEDVMIAAEDSELSRRLRATGARIIKLDAPMTRHDLAMRTVKQYWKRSYRSGYGFAEVHARHPDFWRKEVSRIDLRGGFFLLGILCLPLSALCPWLLAVTALSSAFLLRPRIRLVGYFMKDKGLTRAEARAYAWHASLIVVPQWFGMARYRLGRLLSRPLLNRTFLGTGAGRKGKK